MKEASERAKQRQARGGPLKESHCAIRKERLAAEIIRRRKLHEKIDEVEDSARLSSRKELCSELLSEPVRSQASPIPMPAEGSKARRNLS